MQPQDRQLLQSIEALIFASEEALSAKTIAHLIAPDAGQASVEEAVLLLNQDYAESGRSFRIHAIAGGYRFLTEPEFGDLVRRLLDPVVQRRLSRSMLEVLAVVAWHQPVTKGDVLQIRGVSPDYAVDRLLERELIEVRGRADTPGRPLQYGTTKQFLDLFHLSSIRDLPKLREMKEILQEYEEQQYMASAGDATISDTVETSDNGKEKE